MCCGPTSALSLARHPPNRPRHRASAPPLRHPRLGFSLNPSVQPANAPPLPVHYLPPHRHPSSRARGGASAPSTRCSSFVLTRTAPMTAGPVVEPSAPTVIPVASHGGHCSVCWVTALTSRPRAGRCTGSGCHSIDWYGRGVRWLKGWASAPWPQPAG
jgi:hypothetical protein